MFPFLFLLGQFILYILYHTLIGTVVAEDGLQVLLLLPLAHLGHGFEEIVDDIEGCVPDVD